jgi:hypothetical protein
MGCLQEGEMLFTVAFTFLAVWVIAAAGPFGVGQMAHGLLLVGLMLLLLAFMKTRDAAAAAERASEMAVNGRAKSTSRSKDRG